MIPHGALSETRKKEYRVIRTAAQLAVVLPGLAWAGALHAQRAMVADRPDFTEATSTVGQGVFQFEFGYTFGMDDADGATTLAHSYGEPLLRVGFLADQLEFRVGAGAATLSTESHGRTATESGLEDLYLGVKLAFAEQRGAFPAMAILPQVTLATGGDAFSAGRSLPGVNFLYSWDFTETVSLAGSTQVNAAVGDRNQDYAEWAQSLSCGVALGERAGLYGEWYAFVPSGLDVPVGRAGKQTEHYVNGGLAWLASEDLQWDVRVGLGLNDAAEDLYVGAGVVFRIR